MANTQESSNTKVLPVILSGESGTRLWPLSRESYPKQFININSENKKTLLQKTVERTLPIKNVLTKKVYFLLEKIVYSNQFFFVIF